MRYLVDNHDNPDPSVNLALEEYCLKRLDDRHEYVLLYRNDPSVIVGRNQNILQEIDRSYVEAQRLQVLRRISGGGAVYHDRGNLNISFIRRSGAGGLQDVPSVLLPVLRSLRIMGVDVHFNDRSDLLVDAKKVSGSARFSNTRGALMHCTLLFDADLWVLARALRPPENRLQTKAVRSVRHPVANIRPMLDRPMDPAGFADRLLALLGRQMGGMRRLSLDDRSWQQVDQLAADKYRSWEWTFGRTPDFSVMKNGRGNGRLRVDVHRGKITAIANLDADNGMGPALEERLTGTRYERNEIRRALDGFEFPTGSHVLDAEQLTNAICYN